MRKTLYRSITIVLMLVLIVAGAVLIRHRRAGLENLKPPARRAVPAAVKSVSRGTLTVMQHYIGTIEPVGAAALSAQITGYLTAVHKDAGDSIAAGETAAEIDMRLALSHRDALAAELSGARKDFKIKQVILERRQSLIRDRVVSKENMDQTELSASLAESQVQRLEQELAAASVSLSFTRINSLFNGVVTRRLKNVGDLVTPGVPVLEVEDSSRGYRVLVKISQNTAADLPGAAQARLIHDDQMMETIVDRVYPAIVTGNLATLEIRTEDRPFGLPSYSIVGVDLAVAEPAGWIMDRNCILETESGAKVFAVENDRIVSVLPVTVRGMHGNKAVVDGPLTRDMSLAAGPESMLLILGQDIKIFNVPGETP
ncbi:MAG: efflux RND transporter periplasmic adaptor subunit [Thermodesulfobacteriota bacterium]|nr:efflux RND transporter periplasmic adaptor subunit [Thermodesulfobacteriota bacterium]